VNICIYRKPTYTDTIIPHTSNHPTQHKYAAIRFLYNRLNTYQLCSKEYEQEENIIHNILHNNQFPPQNNTQKHQHNHTTNLIPFDKSQPCTLPKKWCTFTHIGKETLLITKIFKQTNLRIAYRTNNTLRNNLVYHNKKLTN
jgi:hypothetical protein